MASSSDQKENSRTQIALNNHKDVNQLVSSSTPFKGDTNGDRSIQRMGNNESSKVSNGHDTLSTVAAVPVPVPKTMTNGCPSPTLSSSSSTAMSMVTNELMSTSTSVPEVQVVCPFCDTSMSKTLIRKHLTKHMSCSIVCLPCEESMVQYKTPCDVHKHMDTVMDMKQLPTIKSWLREYIYFSGFYPSLSQEDVKFWKNCFFCAKLRKNVSDGEEKDVLESDNFELHLRNHLRYYNKGDGDGKIGKLDHLIKMSVENYEMRSVPMNEILGIGLDDDDVITINSDSVSQTSFADRSLKENEVKGQYQMPKEHLEAMERLKDLRIVVNKLDDNKKYNIVRDPDLVLSIDEINDRRLRKSTSKYDPYKDVQVIRSEMDMKVPETYPTDVLKDGTSKDEKFFCLFCGSKAKCSEQSNNKKKNAKNLKNGPILVEEVDKTSKFLNSIEEAKDHYYRHLNYFPFQCKICSEVTTNELKMSQHIKRMHNKSKSVKVIKELLPSTENWVENFLNVQSDDMNKNSKGRPLTIHSSCPVCILSVEEGKLNSAPIDKIKNCHNLLSHISAHLGYQSFVCIRCPNNQFKAAIANYTLFDHVFKKHPEAMNEPLDTTFKRSAAVKELDEFIKNYLSNFRMSVKFSMQIFIPTAYKEKQIENEKKKEEKIKLKQIQAEEEKIMNERASQEQGCALDSTSVNGTTNHTSTYIPTDNNRTPMSSSINERLQSIMQMDNNQQVQSSNNLLRALLPKPNIPQVNDNNQQQTNYYLNALPNGSFTVDARLLSSHPNLINQLTINPTSIYQPYQQPMVVNSGQNMVPQMVAARVPQQTIVSTSNDVLGLVSKLTPTSFERETICLDLDPTNFNVECPNLGSDVLPNFNYFCIFCERADSQPEMESKTEAIAHYGSHLNYKPVICLICSRRFSDITTLKTHHKLMHKVNVNDGSSVPGAQTASTSKSLQMLYFLQEDPLIEKWIDSFLKLQKSCQIFNLIDLKTINNCIVCERLTDTCARRDQDCPSGSKDQTSSDKPKNAGHELSLDHIYRHLNYAPYECIACSFDGIQTMFSVVEDGTDRYKLQDRNQKVEDLNQKVEDLVNQKDQLTDNEKKDLTSDNENQKMDIADNNLSENKTTDNNLTDEKTDKEQKKEEPKVEEPKEEESKDNIRAINHLKSVHGMTDDDLNDVTVSSMFFKKFTIQAIEDSVHKYLMMKKVSNMVRTRNEMAAKVEKEDDLINSDFEDDYEPCPVGGGKKRKAWIPEKELKPSSVCCLHCHAHVSSIKKLKRHHYSCHPQFSIATYSPGSVDKIKLI